MIQSKRTRQGSSISTPLEVESRIAAATLLERVELQRLAISSRLAKDLERRSELGQFLTPHSIARLMASMIDLPRPPQSLRVLDAGGGNAMLTAAVVAEMCNRPGAKPRECTATIWEIDPELTQSIRDTCSECEAVCANAGVRFSADIRSGDFIQGAVQALGHHGLFVRERPTFDLAILNPPYRKLRSESTERHLLRQVGIETSNLYSAFVWLAMMLLKDAGELIAITPRSYMNGSYFKPFRQAMVESMRFRRVHVYESRNTAFGGDDVLQENAIIHAIKGGPRHSVHVTTSHGPEDNGITSRTLDASEFVNPSDPDLIMHVVPNEHDAQISERMRELPHTLGDLGVQVSTGRVVDFRSRDRLRQRVGRGDAPMIYPRHFLDGWVKWPRPADGKVDAIHIRDSNDPDLVPVGWYVLVKRFSAKEEKRRVVAAVFDPESVDASVIGFDNKLNVLHYDGKGLSSEVAKGLAVFLNSTAVDAYFRQFSGHTQVNARDIRSLRFPSVNVLERLSKQMDGRALSQAAIDQTIREEIPSMTTGNDPIAAKSKVDSALSVLQVLNAPKEQRNERSALTLLALLDLEPESEWAGVGEPLRGVTEIMDWMSEKYGRKYAPNTRETIRRFTLHQFIEMGLVVLNPDNPARAPNSPKNVYQIEPSALQLLRSFGGKQWEANLAKYQAALGDRNRLREVSRVMTMIPVTLPDGQQLKLTAGGQNVLVKEIVEQFAPRFTPGGHMVYVGDAGEKHLLNDTKYLAGLGVQIDPHGKMPDVVIHYKAKNWLILVEAVTSHGPVNLLRHRQLKDLFAKSKAGLVFVTAFLDRAIMREYLPEIAWETEVWVADAPSHLIHFNGERFLGPHP